MKKTFFVLFILYLAVLISCKSEVKTGEIYFCPMHPQITSDKPGNCPICGMKLVKKEKEEGKKLATEHKHNQEGAGSENKAVVKITEAQSELLRLKTKPVIRKRISKTIRTSGVVVPNEKRIYNLNTKVEGWVEKLFVNITGQFVKKGEPLIEIYSPEIFSAESEYLSAISYLEKSSDTPFSSEIVESARKKLLFLDIPEREIEELKKGRIIKKSLILYSPFSGYVFEKNVLEGQKIDKGETLLKIADLSTVWVESNIFETDLPYINTGMKVNFLLPTLKEKSFEGRVFLLNPFLDEQTRTLKAIMEIKNDEGFLKPNMFGDAYLSYEIGERLAIPESAVIKAGERDYAFMMKDDNSIIPVEVEVGIKDGDYFELKKGLNENDMVITSANFLIDSESSLKGAFEALEK